MRKHPVSLLSFKHFFHADALLLLLFVLLNFKKSLKTNQRFAYRLDF